MLLTTIIGEDTEEVRKRRLILGQTAQQETVQKRPTQVSTIMIFQAPSQDANYDIEIFETEEAVAEARAKSKLVHLFKESST
jgi:hypothetical protein